MQFNWKIKAEMINIFPMRKKFCFPPYCSIIYFYKESNECDDLHDTYYYTPLQSKTASSERNCEK